MILALAGAACLLVAQTMPAGAVNGEDPWPGIREALFEDRDIQDGSDVLGLNAPDRALDAAVVPIEIEAKLDQTDQRYIQTIHLVIDENPAPIAGIFHLTPKSGLATIATRVRVNEYTHIRAIAETSDGELYMTSRYVKATGGCAAPALKDHDSAMARLGKMKLKTLTPFALHEPNQAQLMISHPNYSGLQMDQLSRNWIPPHFIDHIEITYGDETVLTVEGDISLSENPSIRFSFVPQTEGTLAVEATDTEGGIFAKRWPIERGKGV